MREILLIFDQPSVRKIRIVALGAMVLRLVEAQEVSVRIREVAQLHGDVVELADTTVLEIVAERCMQVRVLSSLQRMSYEYR